MNCPKCGQEIKPTKVSPLAIIKNDPSRGGWTYERYNYFGSCEKCKTSWEWERIYEFGDITETKPMFVK